MSENKSCSGNCENCESKDKENAEDCKIKQTLSAIRHKIVVMSGKGGVGKSTVAANLAFALALEGKRVGLLDVDIHGPSIPKMLRLEGAQLAAGDGKIIPPEIGGLKVMSIGFWLKETDAPVIWRGPMKIGVIRQMFTEIAWGELDCLVVDCPPGTGDEPLTVCQLLEGAGGAVLVTTPQQVAASDVSKSINFCRQLSFPVIGIVENMSFFVCPDCGGKVEIFASGAGEKLAEQYGLELLGKLPVDPAVCKCGDDGRPFVHFASGTAVAEAFSKIADAIGKKVGI